MSEDQKGNNWRFLIVEDQEEKVRQLLEIVPYCVDAPDTVAAVVFSSFRKAAERLRDERFDLLILDLKDDSDSSVMADAEPAGLAIFEELKKTRFVPVVFYTALAHKVRDLQTTFVRVVEKTEDVTKVKDEARRVLATQLPALTRSLEELQRSYMWEFVSTHWKEFPESADQADIAYLLARRLAIALGQTANEFAVKVGGDSQATSAETKTHPMAMYIVPAIGPHPRAGDIISRKVEGQDMYWLVLTPTCDFAQCKADHFALAKCERLVDREEFKAWQDKKDERTKKKLEQLIEDKRGDRYKFLPRAFFVPDLVVDFQQLKSLDIKFMADFTPVATLDSPFAESVAARFSRYFNRLGTPDLDKTIVLSRLQVGGKQTAKEKG